MFIASVWWHFLYDWKVSVICQTSVVYATVTLELWVEALLWIYFSAISFLAVVKLFACISHVQRRVFCCWKTQKQLQALLHCAHAEILMGHGRFAKKKLEMIFVLIELSFKNKGKKKQCGFLLLVFLYTLPCAPLKFSRLPVLTLLLPWKDYLNLIGKKETRKRRISRFQRTMPLH